MGMITLIGGEKGGTGKSTLATNLAAWQAHRGKDVLIVDADKQGTASNWASNRAEHAKVLSVHCVQKHGNLCHSLSDLKGRYESILIDAGGRDSEELRSAMVVADKVVSPLKASQSDLWTVQHLSELVTLARGLNPKLKAAVVISMASPHPRISETQDAEEMLREFRNTLSRSKTVIHERKAYRDAMVEGMGVVEMKDDKALQEIEALAKEVYRGKI